SDTGQIVKDIERNQLTIRAPQAEAFSGTIDGEAPAALEHLRISGEGLATVVVVCDDEQDLGSSRRLVISRTAVQGEEEIDGPDVSLEGMRRPGAGEKWLARITRPRDLAGSVREVNFDESSNQLILPTGVWHE